MLQTQEQRPGKAAEVTIPGPQNQNANVLEPGFSTHLHPQFRHHREWGVGPPWHGVGMDMAHWGPAAGPHAQRGLRGERTGQGAGGRQGPAAWDTGGLFSVRKTGLWGRSHMCTGHSRCEPPAGNGGLAFPSCLHRSQNPSSLLQAEPPSLHV